MNGQLLTGITTAYLGSQSGWTKIKNILGKDRKFLDFRDCYAYNPTLEQVKQYGEVPRASVS